MYRDDYNAKIRFWARNPRVASLPKMTLPIRLGANRFPSYEAYNAWKRDVLRRIARAGGVKWSP